jgi:hypothetical protein
MRIFILLCLENCHAFTEPEQIDNIIRAELPDQACDLDGSLTEIVKKVMVHGPCGTQKAEVEETVKATEVENEKGAESIRYDAV